MKKLIFLIIVIGVIGLSGFAVYREGTLPVDKTNKSTKIFVIEPGEGLTSVAKKLNGEGLIRNRLVFYGIVKKLGIERQIQAGDFRLSPSMDAYEIAETLTHGTLDIWVTIREGLRKDQVAEIMAKSFNVSETEFNQNAEEGYLFPDTYLIPRQATSESIITILKNNFNTKVTLEIISSAQQRQLDEHELITLASLVERETQHDEDRKKVASILLKRIENEWALQVDATIQYALGYDTQEKTWWKKSITFADLEVESPYNTYKNKGFPPGPIANPGLASIKAAAEADSSTPYWFYLSDKSGKMYYSRTIEEHDAQVKKYLE